MIRKWEKQNSDFWLLSCSATCLLQTTAVGIAGSPRREGSTAAVISLDGDTAHLAIPNPLALALTESTQGYFFPLFPKHLQRGSPCTTHPCGTPNKPSGLTEEKKKEKGRFKVQHCTGFPFPSLSASFGSWEKSSGVGSSCTKGVGGRVREESLGCYVGVKSLWKGKGGGKYLTWIKQIKENVIWIRYSKIDFFCRVFL